MWGHYCANMITVGPPAHRTIQHTTADTLAGRPSPRPPLTPCNLLTIYCQPQAPNLPSPADKGAWDLHHSTDESVGVRMVFCWASDDGYMGREA